MLSAMFWIAIAGVAGASVYLVLVLAAARRFRTQPVPRPPEVQAAVTLLKPLHGDEPQLEESLESFFRQNYPAFEIVFGARHGKDPALALVEKLRKRYPEVPVQVVLSGDPDRANAKICTLLKMLPAARHGYLILSDSDVRVGPDYIQEVMRPLADRAVGMATCLYRGVPTGGFWSRLEALGMSVEMSSGVLVADMLEGMKFALGPTMAIRKDVLQEIGGLEELADYHSDDFVLGKLVSEAGYKVCLSHYVIEHIVLNQAMMPSLQHQARWLRTARFCRPSGHIGTGLTFAVPFGILGALSGWALGMPLAGMALLLAACANRMVQSVAVGWFVVRDPHALRSCWLYPLRDLLGFLLWVWSYLGTTIVWRGERYRLGREGRMMTAEPLLESGLPPRK
jgi:ceramide glucosyltransferase